MKLNFKRLTVLLLVLALLVPGLAACGDSRPELRVFNWQDYIDPAMTREFEKEFNVRVKYITFTDNEVMYAKLKNGTFKVDVTVPSDYMIERMIAEDMLATLDYANIPNVQNIIDFCKNKPFDPNNQYSLPYMWGTLGVLYDHTQVTKPVSSFDILWDNDYKNDILMIDSLRDAIGIGLVREGYSLNNMTDEALNKAKVQLVTQKPLLQAYTMDNTKTIMKNSGAKVAACYSGEAMVALVNAIDTGKNNLSYFVPKHSNIWFDNMVVLKTSEQKELAEKFINFMCSYDVAKTNAEYIGYSSPVAGVQDALHADGVPNIIPSREVLDTLEGFRDVGTADMDRLTTIWTEVKR